MSNSVQSPLAGRGGLQETSATSDHPIGLFRRIDFAGPADPCRGEVRWSPAKSLWWSGMFAAWLVLGSIHFSWGAVGVFLALSALTLCLGHSIGMHRLLIHEAFDSPAWLEKVLVYLGTLVGLGGPFMMMRTHDMRDWAQRQPRCHAFLSHRSGIVKDAWWQLHCKLHLSRPPDFRFPDKLTASRFHRLLERTSMLQQVPVALALLAVGGWGWVAWGVCGRVAVSIFGHWIIGYFAHNRGPRDWHVRGAAVQGHNVPFCGLITFGECWHNNHHAFPSSARLGLEPGQADPGWWVLQTLERLGLISGLKQPADMPARPELVPIGRASDTIAAAPLAAGR